MPASWRATVHFGGCPATLSRPPPARARSRRGRTIDANQRVERSGEPCLLVVEARRANRPRPPPRCTSDRNRRPDGSEDERSRTVVRERRWISKLAKWVSPRTTRSALVVSTRSASSSKVWRTPPLRVGTTNSISQSSPNAESRAPRRTCRGAHRDDVFAQSAASGPSGLVQ